MGGVTSVQPHLSEFEVSLRLKQTAGRERRRWLVIWNALVVPRPASEIALHTDVSVATVHSVVSRYNRFGPKAIEGHEYGIRRRCYLSEEEEAEFLKPFLEVAPTGEICVARPIKEALGIYEREMGKFSHVVLDVIIPERGGRECFGKLAEVNPNVKVLVAASCTSGRTTNVAEDLGAKGFVNKPFNVMQLLQVVRTVLGEP